MLIKKIAIQLRIKMTIYLGIRSAIAAAGGENELENWIAIFRRRRRRRRAAVERNNETKALYMFV